MGIQAKIEELKAKPEHVRRRYSFWGAFAITAVVFAFWVSSFGAFESTAKSSVATTVSKANTPAQSLIAGVGSFFTDVKEIIFGAKKINYGSVEVSPGKN